MRCVCASLCVAVFFAFFLLQEVEHNHSLTLTLLSLSLTLTLQVFVLLDSLHLLEIKRIRGSIIRYSELIKCHIEELKLQLNSL